MKIKVLAFAVMALLVTNMSGFARVDERRSKTKKKTKKAQVVAMLPASDGVAVFDSKRFLGEALPRVLSANQPMLDHINTSLDTIRDRTAIDMRKFDTVAIGVAYKKITATETDYEPLIIATANDMNLGALIAAAKIASNGAYRTETVSGKQIFIFKVDPTKIAPQQPATTNSKITDAIDRIMNGLSKEIAVTSIGENTLVIGTVARVTETLGGKSHLSTELSSLVAAEGTSVLSFAMRPPAGLASLLPLESDELGKTIASIKVISGKLDITAAGGDLHLAARTGTADEALNLRDTLEVGQSFGKMAFAGKKRPDQMVYARMIDSVKIGHDANNVTVDLLVPQADIDVLVAGIK